MNKKIALFVILAILVFSSGCKGGKFEFKSGSLFKRPASSPIEGDYHSGYNTLEMEFMQYAPPSEIWEGSIIPIRVELRNKGACDIKDGDLYIFNYNEQNEFRIKGEERISFSIEGRSADNPDGGYEVIEFEAKNDKAPKLKKLTFSIDACYNYGTNAVIPVCINPYSNNIASLGKRGCQIQSVSTSGQGGPVTVSKVEPKIVPQSGDKFKMLFKVYLDNKGKGKIREASENCGGKQIVFLDLEISDLTMSKGEFACKGIMPTSNLTSTNIPVSSTTDSPYVYYYLMKNKGDNAIFCDVEFDRSKGSYITPLIVYMTYGYSTSIEETIKVMKYEE